jgi:hypothetical protein
MLVVSVSLEYIAFYDCNAFSVVQLQAGVVNFPMYKPFDPWSFEVGCKFRKISMAF